MADIATSVLARLKNKAAESGRSYQALPATLLSGGVSAQTGKVQICGKSGIQTDFSRIGKWVFTLFFSVMYKVIEYSHLILQSFRPYTCVPSRAWNG